ncbi:MAG TPA: dockerin type I repeat-containing protein [Planctomycetota bacterium]|nr:dockerin type I repeat-containing protein [Planctomycetota bacterium]
MERSLRSTWAWTVSLLLAAPLAAQEPHDPEDWPATIDDSRLVHYVSTDFAFAAPSDTWIDSGLQILTGGDQVTEPITIGGHDGVQVTGNYLNVRDSSFADWAEHDFIDILVQVYGDESILGAGGNPRSYTFLMGTLPDLSFPVGGSIPAECKNRQWNWILFRLPNGLRADGTRFVGSVPAGAQGDVSGGGVNGGTIRFEGVPGLKTRLIAFGELGAFGEPELINICSPPEECPPEPETNLASVDVDAGTSDHLEVLNSGDQTVTFQDDVGPAGDLRSAVRPNMQYINFGISDLHFGEPCNDPRAVKVCVELYDDPALVGVSFGPEAFATDDQGSLGFFPADRRHILEGTGTWVRRSWTVPAVSLAGVNTAPLTGGPRLISEGGTVFISRVDMAVLRTGAHPLAEQDPLADCFDDPRICTDAYGNYAELDLGAGIENGITPGTSGGDQEMITEEAGPVDDRRQAIRPAFDNGTPGFAHQFMNFSIVGEPLGPSSQPNARLAICVAYYDDPELLGATFRPEVYQTERGGVVTFGFTSPAIAVTLEGTDAWREAYFEIPDMKFQGVNQGPQAAARFVFSGKVFFTRVRYAVIRPCGPQAGENILENCAPVVPPETLFVRGDSNADASRNISDAVYILGYLFTGGADPPCLEAADTNNDGGINITDGVYLLGFLFLGGPAPPAPFPECGPAEPDASCAAFPPCE